MCLIGIEAAQVFIVIFIEEVELIIDKPGVFFLEYLLEDALYLVAVAVITAVFRHLVNEEQREALDAEFE